MDQNAKISPSAYTQLYFRSLYDEGPYSAWLTKVLDVEKNFLKFTEDPASRIWRSAMFEARYRSVELLLQEFIEKKKYRQIIELGSGLAPMGLNITEKYPNVSYIEVDKSHVTGIKKNLIELFEKEQKTEHINLHVYGIDNILNWRSWQQITSVLPLKPVFVCGTGFLSHFNELQKRKLAANIRKVLNKFGGVWVTPDPAMNKERRQSLIRENSDLAQDKKVAEISGRNFEENEFETEDQASHFFWSEGFNIETQPQYWGFELKSPHKLGFTKEEIAAQIFDLKKYAKIWLLTVL